MSKRLTYREQLDKARQQAVVAGLREAARLVADGNYNAARPLLVEAINTVNHKVMDLAAAPQVFSLRHPVENHKVMDLAAAPQVFSLRHPVENHKVMDLAAAPQVFSLRHPVENHKVMDLAAAPQVFSLRHPVDAESDDA